MDLEKTCNHLRWDFGLDTLLDIVIAHSLISIITKCVSTASMQVMWNGAASSSFHPSRGIRQGHLLLPYLCVLCMERLGHLINDEVHKGQWQPIQLRKGGPYLAHIFFADDLVLFAEADLNQIQFIKGCLERFYGSSGERVSLAKSLMYISKNVPRSRAEQLNNCMSFKFTDNPGKYLSVPSLHERVNKSTYDNLVDKVTQRIGGWEARQSSLMGRTTLLKSMLSSIPL